MIRGVWQCQKLIVSFDRSAGSSAGVREFIQKGAFTDYALANPQMQIEVRMVGGNKHPVVTAEYLNGTTHTLSLRLCRGVDIRSRLDMLRNRSGRHMANLKRWHKPLTPVTSVQGLWSPELRFITPTIEDKKEVSAETVLLSSMRPGQIFVQPSALFRAAIAEDKKQSSMSAAAGGGRGSADTSGAKGGCFWICA